MVGRRASAGDRPAGRPGSGRPNPVDAPELLPVLSKGKHRSPRKGACLMEFVSVLAGEPWSDRPACTHPLLAALAREVNDHLADAARHRIAPLAPDLIGLDRAGPVIAPLLAREVALTALPIAPAKHQRVAAVGLLHCEHVLAMRQGRRAGELSTRAAAVLAGMPAVHEWAREFCGLGFGRPDTFDRRGAPSIVHSAVAGITQATGTDPDDVLVDLLRRSIADCRSWMGSPGAMLPASDPSETRRS